MQTNVLQCLQNLSRLHSTEKKKIKSETLDKKEFSKYKYSIFIFKIQNQGDGVELKFV